MHNVDDRTLEWFERTQQLRKAAPLRGGIQTDYRARQQTAASVAAIVVVMIVLYALPVRSPASTSSAAGAGRVPGASAAPVVATAGPAIQGVTMAAPGGPALWDPRKEAPTFYGTTPPPTPWLAPPPGCVPPPAPIWLDGQNWAHPRGR